MTTPTKQKQQQQQQQHPKVLSGSSLDQLEKQLEREVDPAFFTDHATFPSMSFVIDILEANLDEHRQRSRARTNKQDQRDLLKMVGKQAATGGKKGNANLLKDQFATLETTELTAKMLHKNNIYKKFKSQAKAIDLIIEEMAMFHCSALNGGVEQIGRVNRQFKETVDKVRYLRGQVRGIKETISPEPTVGNPEKNEGAQSLRELWLKKLECEAVLSLLAKIEIIREAPLAFDNLLPPLAPACRIGAASTLLANAMDTMFSEDVAQVQALTKVMDQLMTRKQKAEDILWDSLHAVLYLRNGGAMFRFISEEQVLHSTAAIVEESGMAAVNDYQNIEDLHIVDKTLQMLQLGDGKILPSRLLSSAILDSEIDLEEDELRCLAETDAEDKRLPIYTDSVFSLRILVESLQRLGRLDDIERFLAESVKREIRRVSDRAQNLTFEWMDRKRNEALRTGDFDGIKRRTGGFTFLLPDEIRYHLSVLLLSFENVMFRLSLVTQIIRHKKSKMPFYDSADVRSPASPVLEAVITLADKQIQDEIKTFLRSCLNVKNASSEAVSLKSVVKRFSEHDSDMRKSTSVHESGLFSLGIIDDIDSNTLRIEGGTNMGFGGISSAREVAKLSIEDFASSVLFSNTGNSPNVRLALLFRYPLAKWANIMTEVKRDLGYHSGDDVERIKAYPTTEDNALGFLDLVIQRQLLPLLQSEAMDRTISALERDDAFKPVMSNSNFFRKATQPENELCHACQVFLDATAPLFAALHQLPKDGQLFAPVVAVMEHASLTFISRAKQRIREVCSRKTADALLGGGEGGNGGKEAPFSLVIKERRAYKKMLAFYDHKTDSEDRDKVATQESFVPLLPPSSSDTKAKHARHDSFSNPDSSSSGPRHSSDFESDLNVFAKEIQNLGNLLRFAKHDFGKQLVVCNEEEIMGATCLAHSLLRLGEQLELRLVMKDKSREDSAVSATRALRSAISTIKALGRRMANFLRVDILVHTIKYISKLPMSNVLTAEDTVRLPACINDLGEFIAMASDSVYEIADNTLSAYAMSSLEQYIPLLVIQAVKTISNRDGLQIIDQSVTMNGIDSLERVCSMLYRDLKSVACFEGSFWNESTASDAFEHAANYAALLELDDDELVAYFKTNWGEFSADETKAMFSLAGPRRMPNLKLYEKLKSRMTKK